MRKSCIFLLPLLLLVAADNQHHNPTVLLKEQGKGRVAMPRIALGTGGFDNATAQDAVSKAFEAGFTHPCRLRLLQP